MQNVFRWLAVWCGQNLKVDYKIKRSRSGHKGVLKKAESGYWKIFAVRVLNIGSDFGSEDSRKAVRQGGSRSGCYNFGATDFFKADCPEIKNKRTVSYACDICNGAHYLRQSLKWKALKRIGLKMAMPPGSTSSDSYTRSVRAETSESRVPKPDAAMVVLENISDPSARIETA